MPRFIQVREIASTNTYLKQVASTLPDGTVIYTHCQTAGRGQKGNSWEAEPGKNLTFSQLIKSPAVEPVRQFYISEAVSLAIVEAVKPHVGELKIKWPNDIYWRDSKLCGILIENSLDGNAIAYSVAGVGLNVNQEQFVSNAPNPVSMRNITGKEYDLDNLLRDICSRIVALCDFASEDKLMALHQSYLDALYRNDGNLYTWLEADGNTIQAAIHSVKPDGTLCLQLEKGEIRQYAFKQVKHIINTQVL